VPVRKKKGIILYRSGVSSQKINDYKGAEAYFNKAVAAQKAGDDYKPWVDKLHQLGIFVKTLESNDEEDEYYGSGYPSRLYGIWLRDHEKLDRSFWKECFRTSILLGIEMLNDEDPSNDQRAYASLGMALVHAGDVEAGAPLLCLSAISSRDIFVNPVPIRETSNDVTNAEPDHDDNSHQLDNPTNVKSNLPLVKMSDFTRYWICYGTCVSVIKRITELHFCQICNETVLCDQCLVTVKEKKNKYRLCNPDHKWIQIYPVPEGMTEFGAATVRNGYVEVNRDWLEKLKADWVYSIYICRSTII